MVIGKRVCRFLFHKSGESNRTIFLFLLAATYPRAAKLVFLTRYSIDTKSKSLKDGYLYVSISTYNYVAHLASCDTFCFPSVNAITEKNQTRITLNS